MEGKKEGRHLLKGNVEERGELLNILVDILQQRNVTNGEKRTVQLHHGFNNLEAERGRESTKSKLMCAKGKRDPSQLCHNWSEASQRQSQERGLAAKTELVESLASPPPSEQSKGWDNEWLLVA